MSDESVYNQDLSALENLLRGVKQPGDFFVHATIETPLPRIEIYGVGVISFPIPESQLTQIIQRATRAPYGRGDQTIYDDSVRKVWQLSTEQVQISGKSWSKTFSEIIARVADGLGCGDAKITAELYKLLIYDQGAFFKSHRDTEKTEGMFGTLVISLPSLHQGGELIIRHAGREVVVDLASNEISELKWTAFYADCEHEVRPVTAGHRVCLIFNLIQLPGKKRSIPLKAPLYGSEVETCTQLLRNTFASENTPDKLVWLLSHQYSPAGLSFSGLKGEDAAQAKVLHEAAECADCAIHLGIVHIEESGPAEISYDDDDYSYSISRGCYADEDEDDEDDSHSNFEIIEVSNRECYIDGWINVQNQPVAFGNLPLEDDELLPKDALKDETPDGERFTEATGNEGASFERCYHRAALVLWPRAWFVEVLLSAGVHATLPYLADRIAANDPNVVNIATTILQGWKNSATIRDRHDNSSKLDSCGDTEKSTRAEMIRLLRKMGDCSLLERFIATIVTHSYDGSENDALVENLTFLGAPLAERLLCALFQENMPSFHHACIALFSRAVLATHLDKDWRSALQQMATTIVAALPKCQDINGIRYDKDWLRMQRFHAVDAPMVAELFTGLYAVGTDSLRMQAALNLIQAKSIFVPDKVIIPALGLLHERGYPFWDGNDDALQKLWCHAAKFLLTRSEQPPAPPPDWCLNVTIDCDCDDCRALQQFANDPKMSVARFRVRKDRRQHLHRKIVDYNLDMTHVTERKGSPQTLVCTKTRQTYQNQCEQHRADQLFMQRLLKMIPSDFSPPQDISLLSMRLDTARKK